MMADGGHRCLGRRSSIGVPPVAPYNRAMNATAVPSPIVPLKIHADRTARTLEIGWQDGHATVHEFTPLRWLCPCAHCRGEAGMPGWLDSAPTLTAEQTRMVDIQLVGSYAVAPTWGDGHHTGYYTYALLRDRCPCDGCAGRRAAAPSNGPAADRHPDHAATKEDPR